MSGTAAPYCTLTPQELRDRRSQIRATIVPLVATVTQLEDGLCIVFEHSEGLRSLIEEFIALEKQCCGFLQFTLSEPAEDLSLLVQAPPEAESVIEMFRLTVQQEQL